MDREEKILADMRRSPGDVRFDDVVRVCGAHFGPPRRHDGSHVVFSMPWPGDPRVNLQRARGGKAKAYQVRQAVAAIDRVMRESAADREGRDGESD